MNTQNIHLAQGEEAKLPLSMNPRKFIVWLFIVSSVMMFAGWTSAFIVAKAEEASTAIELPSLFGITTILLLVSSVTMHLAYRATKKDNLMQVKLFGIVTLVLGLVFMVGQFYAFGQLTEQNIYFVGANPIHSFLYVLPFMHGLHILAGLIFLLVVMVKAFRYKVHSKNSLSMDMCSTFWHFLDGLWLYLFLFLQFN